MMMTTTAARADEQVTITATNSDISQGLDLRVVAKIFAEAKNLEEFESKLNNPETQFCNLDLNGDGEVDYIRVVETGEGSNRLIILQAVLAQDIYQDIASIYVEKDEATSQVKVEIVGDEYIYGTNYVIVPVFYHRPYIYDWFWDPYWYSWRSPYYWGYYPAYWRPWAPVYVDVYRHHCYDYCGVRPVCSYRNTREVSVRAQQALAAQQVHRQVGATHYTSQRAARAQEVSANRSQQAQAVQKVSQENRTQQVSHATRAQRVQSQEARTQQARTFGSANTQVARAQQSQQTQKVQQTQQGQQRAQQTQQVQRSQQTQRVQQSATQQQRVQQTAQVQKVQQTQQTQRAQQSTQRSSTALQSSAQQRVSTSNGFSGSSFQGGSSRGGYSGGGGFSGGSVGGGGGGGRAPRR